MDKRQAKKNEKKRQESVEKTVVNKETTKAGSNSKPKLIQDKNKSEPQQQIEKTTVYSISTITYTLVSAVVVALSMIIWIKPGYYYLEAFIGKNIDYYSLDVTYEMGFAVLLPKYVNIFFVIIGISCIICTLLAVLMIGKTMKATNKPYPIVSVICFLLSIASVALFFVAVAAMKEKFDESQMQSLYEIEKSFGVYYAMMIAIIANAAVSFAHMIMTFISTSIWKKTGKVR